MLFAGMQALGKVNTGITMGKTEMLPLSAQPGAGFALISLRAALPGWKLSVFFPTNSVLLQEITGDLASHPTSAAHRVFPCSPEQRLHVPCVWHSIGAKCRNSVCMAA